MEHEQSRTEIMQAILLNELKAWPSAEDGSSILSLSRQDDNVKLELMSMPGAHGDAAEDVFAGLTQMEPSLGPRVTSLLPVELSSIIFGFSDGSIARSSFTDLLWDGINNHSRSQSDKGLHGLVTSLHSFARSSGRPNIIVGGSDDGGVGIWSLSELKLLARWVMFATPLVKATIIEHGFAGLQHGLLCVSEDGTVGLVDMEDGYRFLYLVPAASSPLSKACLSRDNLVFLYDNGRARLWDIKTREFWRVMDNEKAEELLEQGGWHSVDMSDKDTPNSSMPLTKMPYRWISTDSGPTLLLAIKKREINSLKPNPSRPQSMKDDSSSGDEEPFADEKEKAVRIPTPLQLILPLLSALFTYGLDEDVYGTVSDRLAVPERNVPVSRGIYNTFKAYSLPQVTDTCASWKIPSSAATYHLLALITVLRVCLSYEEFERHANAVIAFYVASLPTAVPVYQPPSLELLARLWLDSSVDLQQAARTLFGAVLPRMSNNKIIGVAEAWQPHLPCLQPDAETESPVAARALLITGNIAAEKYSLLAISTLRDISKSISMYLHDVNCRYSVLAIELCSRGFQIWQQHLDAVDTLRCLFKRATNFGKDALPAVGNQARLAILQIASASTALFMTTISLDIMHANTPEDHKSIMLIVAFIVRKRPLVLYPSLPRLVEAVVKSLDPNSSSRDAVLQAATVILDQLVQIYPSVAFNAKVQRLAVGTSEGAVIMYDLKTATMLYVLEAHRKPVSACSFSPDGRRLVSASLEESVVVVWKVGSSFSGLFNPGGPPRQGHAGSEPYKTLPFNIGEEDNMTVAATLEWVTFEWPGERSARLKIRDSTFTFNT